MGVVTATTYSSLSHDFATLGLSKELFDYIQTEEDTKFHKPDPKVFEPALNWLARNTISPQEVLYVGDHLRDMQAAKRAGFHFIGVTTGLTSMKEFEEHQTQSIKELSELLSLEDTLGSP